MLDSSGGVVSGVKVTAINAETGLERTAISNSQGAYLLVELPVGHYRINATAKGFQKYVQEGVSLDVNQAAVVTIHLAVGMASEEVHVLAERPQFLAARAVAAGDCSDNTGTSASRLVAQGRASLRREWPAPGIEQFPDRRREQFQRGRRRLGHSITN